MKKFLATILIMCVTGVYAIIWLATLVLATIYWILGLILFPKDQRQNFKKLDHKLTKQFEYIIQYLNQVDPVDDVFKL